MRGLPFPGALSEKGSVLQKSLGLGDGYHSDSTLNPGCHHFSGSLCFLICNIALITSLTSALEHSAIHETSFTASAMCPWYIAGVLYVLALMVIH